jgi:hypothetical protein
MAAQVRDLEYSFGREFLEESKNISLLSWTNLSSKTQRISWLI